MYYETSLHENKHSEESKLLPYRNLVLIGPPGAGKSVLAGQLTTAFGGQVFKKNLQRCMEEALNHGHNKQHGYAFLVDQTYQDRTQGRTIRPAVPFLICLSRVRYGIMAPSGDPRYLKSFCAAVSAADLLILLVPVVDYERYLPLISDQLKISHSLGLATQMIVGFSKCDCITEGLDLLLHQMKAKLTEEIKTYFSIIGYFATDFCGADYSKPHVTSTSLAELLDFVPAERYKNCVEDKLICSAGHIFRIRGVGTVVCAKVLSGKVELKKPIALYAGVDPYTLRSMELHFEAIYESQLYSLIGFHLGCSIRSVWRGMLLSDKPYAYTEWVSGNVIASNRFHLRPGSKFCFYSGSARSVCTIHKLSANPTSYHHGCLEKDSSAILYMSFDKPIVMFHYKTLPTLGSFILSAGLKLCATGTTTFVSSRGDSFDTFQSSWPKSHPFLNPHCSDSILGILCAIKRLSQTHQIQIHQEQSKLIIQHLIAHWYKTYKPNRHKSH